MKSSISPRILVLGGSGMLGHKMFQQLRKRFPDTYCTIRGSLSYPDLRPIDLFRSGHVFEYQDVTDIRALENLVQECKPDVVINCVGVVKQRADAKKAIPSLLVNALLPHQLSELCERCNAWLIHFSTDCVFSGNKGNYSEDDVADAYDLYGRTKYLGEVSTRNALTLRTSIIGRELVQAHSLLEWFLSQNHKRVSGYTRALYSGVTTNHLATVVGDLIETYPRLCGLYQVTGQVISKFDLLCLIRDVYKLDIEILPDRDFFCDRSMKGKKFESATGYVSPGWPELISELANDKTTYEEWRMANEML
jgi:dTDP-4-dehydrorhamnose reductase